jgi:small subunit ribosomal protein S18
MARRKKRRYRRHQSRCRFCRESVERIDYKDLSVLHKLTTSQGKLFSRKRAGNCAKHQRMARAALKRARYLALMPYVGR